MENEVTNLASASVEFADAVGTDTVCEVEAQFLVEEDFRTLPDVIAIPHLFAIGADRDVALLGLVFGEQGEKLLDGFFVFLGLGFGRAEEFGMEQSPMNRRSQTIQMAFLDKIGDPRSEFINLHFPTQGIGHEDKRHVRAFFMSDGEGSKTIKSRQTVIREDDIRGIRGKCMEKLITGFDAVELEFEPMFLEGTVHGLRIGGDIFHEDDGYLLVHDECSLANRAAGGKSKRFGVTT